MEMFYVDENGQMNSLNKLEDNGKLTPDSLRARVRDLDVMADVEILSPYRGVVRVHKGIGTTMYLAQGENNHEWLKSNAIKKEDKGSLVVYHFVFD